MASRGKPLSKYRCFFPLLFSFAALLLFLPVYDAGLAYCDAQPLENRMDCVFNVTLSVSWAFLVPFILGIVVFAYRAYQDWCQYDFQLSRRSR